MTRKLPASIPGDTSLNMKRLTLMPHNYWEMKALTIAYLLTPLHVADQWTGLVGKVCLGRFQNSVR